MTASVVLPAARCTPPTPASWRFEAIGTAWEIASVEPVPAPLRDTVLAAMDRFDREWSRFRPDSVVSGLALDGGSVVAPPDTAPMLDLYAALADETEDAVNPLVGETLARRGYDGAYGFHDLGARPARPWRHIVAWDAARLAVAEPALLDVGALGKGRLVDRVHDLVTATVDGPVTVDASGDLRLRGTERVGLEHPYDPRRALGVWTVTDAALCASAVNRRAWGEGLHHVLDARTGEPVRQIAATWAVAGSAMLADAAATALFFDGGPRFAHDRGVQWVRMTSSGDVEWSPGCTAELFR